MTRPLLELAGISKSYGGLKALDAVSASMRAGEVVGLLGDNGAGKSTLLKVLSGALVPDSGEVRAAGRPVHFRSPRDAEAAGIEMVYQDLALVPTLDAASNMFLGREPVRPGLLGRLGFLDKRRMRQESDRRIAELGASRVPPRREITLLSGGQQQAVAIARATGGDEETILLLDEPTAALGVKQRERIMSLIRALRDKGTLVILITHDLPSCFDLADRLVVMRLGRIVAHVETSQTDMGEVVGWITGARDPLVTMPVKEAQ